MNGLVLLGPPMLFRAAVPQRPANPAAANIPLAENREQMISRAVEAPVAETAP